MINLGRIVVEIDDELDRKIRLDIARKGGKKGALSRTVEEAIYTWVSRSEFDESYNRLRENCRENSLDKERFDQITESIRNDVSKILAYITRQKQKSIIKTKTKIYHKDKTLWQLKTIHMFDSILLSIV